MSWYIVEEPLSRRRGWERRKCRRVREGRKLVTADVRRRGKGEEQIVLYEGSSMEEMDHT